VFNIWDKESCCIWRSTRHEFVEHWKCNGIIGRQLSYHFGYYGAILPTFGFEI